MGPRMSNSVVVGVRGSVIDVRFPEGALPALDDALEVAWDGAQPLILEVHQHLDDRTARCVAMRNTSGLRRGTPVNVLGGPIRVPVGTPLLGRVLDVLGTPIDGGPAPGADTVYWTMPWRSPGTARNP